MKCWRSFSWSRQNVCAAKENSGERFKMSKRCGTCFFPTGRSRENPAHRHTREHACQMAGGIRAQKAVCRDGHGSGNCDHQNKRRQDAARTADADWRQGSIYQGTGGRSEEHTSELQSRFDLVCRLLLEKKKK